MKLLIVESPAKAKTIEKYLAGEYRVKASVGHIRDLPKSNRHAVDIANGFAPHYEIVKGKEKIVEEISQLAKKAEVVMLATDPDREGEAIAWHIKEAANLDHPQRIVFHEITKEAVTAALRQPRAIDENLKTAQEARRVLDRLFGYDLSGLIWQKLRYGLSAGRVQSPALRIIAEREREIKSFVPEKYWELDGQFQTAGSDNFRAGARLEKLAPEQVEKIVASGRQSRWRVAAREAAEIKREPRPPFITSTLQQAASSRLGLSPSQTMRLAQHLYEAGHITYMRTDSTTLSQAAIAAIGDLIQKKFGGDYLTRRQYQTKVKNAQEAHEAIRPSHVELTMVGQTPPEKKLYQLIWNRTVASQMAAAKLLKTKITVQSDHDQVPALMATGSLIGFDGWLKIDQASRGEENELPKLQSGDPLKLTGLDAVAKETEPPKRYSEAGLIKELEKRGIGRPSTYAPIIKTLLDRQYVFKESRSLRPTETGEVVSEFLEKHFGDYISDTFTKELEDELDEIALGRLAYVKMLKSFYQPFTKAVADKKNLPKLTDLGPAPVELKCPRCGGPMIIKLGRTGKFFSCQRFPDCDGSRTLAGEEIKSPQATGELCPECGGALVNRNGRYGEFVACANYPKCKFVKNNPEQNPGTDTGVACPLCHQGTMRERRGRYGVFYGCSNYPQCRYLIKNKPTGKICGYPRETGPCPQLMMAGSKTIPERCSDKTCPNHHPHKLAAVGAKSKSL